MWVAKDKNGNLRWFETKPSRDWGEYKDYVKNELTVWKDGVIQNNEHILPSDSFSNLKWEDEPVEVFLVTGEDYKLLQKKKEEDRWEYLESLTPIEREIINGKNKLELFKCVDRVKRYNFSNHKEYAEFLTINEFLEHDFYTDDGEYEAYLSDGEYFIGVDLHWLGDEECKEFIDKNKHLFGENKTLCIYFVDYPEDK